MFSQQHLAQAKEIIVQFNTDVPEAHRYPVDTLEERLYGLGSSTDEDLKEMKWEEWESIGLPLRLAKKVAAIYRGPEKEVTQATTMTVRTTTDEISELGNDELVNRFAANPSAVHSAVADQLRARSGDRRFIAFNADGSINVETTTMVLNGIASGDRFNGFFKADDRRVYLFKIGERQGDVRDEHPVFVGNTLRQDGLDHESIDWKKVPHECRQFIRLAVITGEIDASQVDRNSLITLRDIAMQNGAFGSLQERYPHAGEMFEERKQLDDLPALRVFAGKRRHKRTSAV